ncbi:hypothetical protein Tco_0139660 [Tanacetum coccineum]
MIRVPVTIKTLVLTNLHSILRASHNSSTVGPRYNQSFSEDQPPFYSSYQQQQFDCCEVCGGPHYSSDCQTRNQLVYEPNPGNNYDFPCFDQPPQYHIDQSPPQELDCHSHFLLLARENNRILEEFLRTSNTNSLVDIGVPEGSDNYTEVTYDNKKCLSDHYTAPVTPLAYTPSIPFLATMEPTDTLLMGDDVISTILARETDEFIKSSVDDLVLISKESEVTSDSDLECDMPATTPLPPTDVKEEDFDINLPLGEYVVDFLMENVDVADLSRHLVKQLFSLLVKNLSSTKRMSDEPLGDDSKSRSYDVNGQEVGLIRRIQGLDTAYWGFLGVGTTFDIFQNFIFIPYFQYGILVFSGYGVLILFPLWSLVSAGTDAPYLP